MERENVEIALVGNGLSALQILQTARQAESAVRMVWRKSQPARSRSPFYVISSSRVFPAAPFPSRSFSLAELVFYFHQTQRWNGEEVLHAPATFLPHPLRRKLIALALFNDLSPTVWSEKKKEPRSHWFEESPTTLLAKHSTLPVGLSVTPQETLWKELATLSLQTLGTSHPVISIKVDSSRKQGIFSFEPPLQAESFSDVICTDYLQLGETALGPRIHVAAYWQSFLTRVPRSVVSALPALSVWTDGHSERFLKTGNLYDQCLKRVLVRDLPESQECDLQIQVLRTDHLAAPLLKVDEFLNTLCPRLPNTQRRYESGILEDDVIFAEPRSQFIKADDILSYWHAGHLAEGPEFFRKILGKFKIKSAVAPLNPSTPA